MPLRFVNPNYHVILVHYPLGVFVLGVFLELFSLLWHKGSVRVAAVWMILIGAILSLPAATSGIYALWDVASSQGVKGERFQLLRLHVIFQSCASLLAVTCAVAGLGASDEWRAKLRLPLLLGVTAACGMMVFGSWNGGETVYQHGTAVQIVDRDGELQKPEKHVFEKSYQDIVTYYIGGEKQIHIITAGFALSAAMAALGLSIRRLTTHRAELAQLQLEARAAGVQASDGGEPRRVTDDLSMMRSINPEAEIEADLAHVPAGRWWLLSALVTLITAATGYWIMSESEFAKPEGWSELVESLKLDALAKWTIHNQTISRHFAHLALGGAMVLLALILGLIARFAPRRPVLLTFFASLMVLVTSGQVWMGVALTFDREGPLTYFRPAKIAAPEMPDVPPAPATPTTTSATPETSPTAAPATPEKSQTAAPATPEKSPTPAPTPPEKSQTPTPTPEKSPTEAPTPEKSPTPAPTPPEKSQTPTPTPPEKSPTEAPTTPEKSQTPTPTPPEKSPTEAPTPEKSPTPAPTPPEKSQTPTPTPPEKSPAEAPTTPEKSQTPTPTPPEKSPTEAPTPEKSPTPAPTPAEKSQTAGTAMLETLAASFPAA